MAGCDDRMSQSDFPVLADQIPNQPRKADWFLAAPARADFAVLRVAEEVWGTERLVRRRAFPNCFIALVGAGRAVLETVGARHEVAAGMVFTMHGHVDVVITIARPLDLRIVSGRGPACDRLMAEHLGPRPAAIRVANPAAVERQLGSLIEAGRAGGPFAQAICDDLFRALVRTIHHGRLAAPAAARGALATFARAKALIDRDPLGSPEVAELARRVDIDRAHLARLFMRFAGVGPAEYAARLRLAHAAEMLANGGAVGAVAERCGYADAFSFSKAFSRRYGVAPSRWRG
jgi:AraC-like DNA-binding protein